MFFDNRIAVVLGIVALMLASVPAITRHPVSDSATASTPPSAGTQVSTVADKPASTHVAVTDVESARAAAPKSAAAGNIATARVAVANIESVRAASPNLAAIGKIATARAVVADVPLPRTRPKTISAVEVASVPLPRARPQSIVIANIPLPKARPLSIATAKAPLPGEATLVADASSEPSPSGAVPNPPLLPARPQSVSVAKMPLPGETTLVADASSKPPTSDAIPNPPLPRARPHSIVIAQTPLPIARPLSIAAAKAPLPGEVILAADASNQLSLSTIEIDPPPLPTARPGRMILVAEARRYLGTNPTNRSRLWCATFMNLILHKIGYPGTHSDAARSFVDYGRRIRGPKIGAIAVLTRGPNGGHVGVVSGVDRHGNSILVSGNHGHRVGIGTYPRSRVIAYVLPVRSAATRSKSDRRRQHDASAATTQFAARGTTARAQADGGSDSPAAELLQSMAAEYRRPSSATLRARSKRGRSASSALAKFFGGKS